MKTASPESMGLCATRLARLDRFLAGRYIASGKLPCAQLLVARGGRLVHQSVLGQASLEARTPLVEDSIVRIYSMTKPITSVAFIFWSIWLCSWLKPRGSTLPLAARHNKQCAIVPHSDRRLAVKFE